MLVYISALAGKQTYTLARVKWKLVEKYTHPVTEMLKLLNSLKIKANKTTSLLRYWWVKDVPTTKTLRRNQ